MHLVMFDVDGTIVKSNDYDSECFLESLQEVLEISIDDNWSKYTNVTDSGILDEIIEIYGITKDRNLVHSKVKKLFIERIQNHLKVHYSEEVDGAAIILNKLRERNDVVLAIATGGWEETAKLKLAASGIDISDIAFASSSDHSIRTEIMKLAEQRCNTEKFTSKTYFGDGVWDQKASKSLNYNFVLVGNQLINSKQIDDFSCEKTILRQIGL